MSEKCLLCEAEKFWSERPEVNLSEKSCNSGATMQGKIGLACILKSDTSPQSIFRVSIHIDRLVEDLHTAIKAKKQVALANVDTSSLCVLKVWNQDHTLRGIW
jgi:hypothetical protein